MKQAGCALVLMSGRGGDSHEGTALGQHLDQLRQVCRLCEDGGLHYTISQGFGEPGETRETVEEKLAFLRDLNPALANLRIGVRMMPGSDVAAQAKSEGMISEESELIKPIFYLAEPVRDWLGDHLQAEASQNPRWNVL
jgi:hypothetical protein